MDGDADPGAHRTGDPVPPRGYRITDRAAAERRFAVFTDVVARILARRPGFAALAELAEGRAGHAVKARAG
jgi:hypothetical protein